MKKKSKLLKRCASVMFAVLCVALLCVPAFASSPTVPNTYVEVFHSSSLISLLDKPGEFYVGRSISSLKPGLDYSVIWNGVEIPCICVELEGRICLVNSDANLDVDENVKLLIAVYSDHFEVFDASGSTQAEMYVYFVYKPVKTIMRNAGDVVTSLTSWIGNVARMVINEPVLLIGFTIGLATLAFGIFKGLKR